MIPTRVHAAMDYLVGLLLVAAPWIFQFADESSAATWEAVDVAAASASAGPDVRPGVVKEPGCEI
jgi:hypothetical protein